MSLSLITVSFCLPSVDQRIDTGMGSAVALDSSDESASIAAPAMVDADVELTRSKYVGVYTAGKRWTARLDIDGEEQNLGKFHSEYEVYTCISFTLLRESHATRPGSL
jgi:hypothetical protein